MTIPPQADASQWIEPPAAAVADGGWKFFGPIYCISLKTRPDRRETAAAAFREVGLDGRVTYFLADKHPTDSEQGIYESHMACLRAGLQKSTSPIVVFEDDVRFAHFGATLEGVVAFLSDRTSPTQGQRHGSTGESGALPRREGMTGESSHAGETSAPWDVFFFGCYVRSSASTPNPFVRSIRYKCTAHAYAVSRAMAERLVAIPWSGVAFDVLLRDLDEGRYFMACPAFAFQSGASTDNDKQLKLDRIRRWFGGMYFSQRWDEFSHRRWRSMIVMHILSIVLIVWICWLIFRRGR